MTSKKDLENEPICLLELQQGGDDAIGPDPPDQIMIRHVERPVRTRRQRLGGEQRPARRRRTVTVWALEGARRPRSHESGDDPRLVLEVDVGAGALLEDALMKVVLVLRDGNHKE
jgi:hypothetical protein